MSELHHSRHLNAARPQQTASQLVFGTAWESERKTTVYLTPLLPTLADIVTVCLVV